VQDSNLRPPACKFSDRWVLWIAGDAETRISTGDSHHIAPTAISCVHLPQTGIGFVLWGNLWGTAIASLPSLHIPEILTLFAACLFVAGMLIAAAVPLIIIIIGYDQWKERVR
jgi:hypothetical protein